MSSPIKTKITVSVKINADIDKVWRLWNDPLHIVNWYFASDSWHAPWAKNDLKQGSKFVIRMEAKDGSMGFDFSGTYSKIDEKKLIESTLDDGRTVSISFNPEGNSTMVTEVFEAESQNPVELQKKGWQAILDNFKKYAENLDEKKEVSHFPIYPCIWFNMNAREAAELYCSVFENTEIASDNNLVVIIKSSGQQLMCLNGGPEYTVNPSISFFVVCETEKEFDKAWEAFLQGGLVLMQPGKYDWSQKYGWIKDKFGVTWQLSLGNSNNSGQKIIPTLMFTGYNNGKAEEAINHYTSVFKDSAVLNISRYPAGLNVVEGAIEHALFSLSGYLLMAMDSSIPHNFNFNEGVSLVVECDTQEEIDHYWDRFTEEGKEVQCGWLTDKFGVSWQIVPSILSSLMSDPERSERVISAFMKMKKFDINGLLNA